MGSGKGGRDFDVVIIGAGISGINSAYRLQERNPDLSYCILESRHEIGGTWSLFKYPGIRSDSDLYTFGFPWRPWTEHESIARGDLIKKYMQESASMYGIDKKIHFNHAVEAGDFDTASKTWTFDVVANGKDRKQIRSNFAIMCTGYYDYTKPLQTTIPGIENFQGKTIHPQFWPEDLDYTNKRITIIGSGATAITLLPVLAEKASHVTMLQRSPSYLLSTPREDRMERTLRAWLPFSLSSYLIRLKWLVLPFLFVSFCHYFPARSRRVIRAATKKELGPDMEIDPHFKPSYNPFEQRLCFCPDGDFYAALRAGTASVATDTIQTVTEKGIKLNSGQELHPDIIVTATGLRLQFAGGMKLSVDKAPYNVGDHFMWKGVMLQDLPNAAFTIGYVDASWTLGADATAQMTCRLLNRMKAEGVSEVVPRMSEQERGQIQERGVLRLTSTYIKKAEKALPKAGDRGQWKPRSYYFEDILMAWFGDIRSGMEWIRGV